MGIAFIEPFDQYAVLDASVGGLGTVWTGTNGAGFEFVTGLNSGSVGRGLKLRASSTFQTNAQRPIVPTKRVTAHMAFRIDGASVIRSDPFFKLLDGDGAFQCGIAVDGFQRLLVVGPAGAIQMQGTTFLASGVIYRACIQFNINDEANHEITISLNGSPEIHKLGNGLDIRASGLPDYQGVQLTSPGFGSSNATSAIISVDDLVVLREECIETGPIEITMFAPNSDSAVSWIKSAGATNFGNVDDLPTTGEADYNSTDVVGAKDFFGFPPPVKSPETIFGLSVMTMIRKEESATRKFRNQFKMAGVEYPGAEFTLSQSYQFVFDNYRTNPANGNPWATNVLAGGITAGYELTV